MKQKISLTDINNIQKADDATSDYRVMAYQDFCGTWLRVNQVLYKNGVPFKYGRGTQVHGETIAAIKNSLTEMLECLEKPILWEDEKFPQEYIP